MLRRSEAQLAPADPNGGEAAVLDIRGLRLDINVRGHTLRALHDVSLDVRAGECVALVGESGSGKTLLALASIGVVPRGGWISGGEVRLLGQDLSALSPRAVASLRGRRVGVVAQDPLAALNPVLTIDRQISEPMLQHLRLTRRAARDRALLLLESVGISEPVETLGRYPHELSGGQRQRALIAQALACDPDLVIADEATSALDVTIQSQVVHLLAEQQRTRGMSLIFITHDLDLAAEVADRIFVAYAGRIVETGPASRITAWPRHPYTAALLAARPNAWAGAKTALAVIPGRPPDLAESSGVPGCPFAARCSRGTDKCRRDRPLHTDFGSGAVACWYPVGVQEPMAGASRD